MSVLQGLWITSLLLSAAAIAVMVGLILARQVSARRAQQREAERRRQMPLMMQADPAAIADGEIESAPDLLTDLTVDIIRLVRGEERENLVASAARLGVPKRLGERLRTGRVWTRMAAAEALTHFADDDSVAALTAALDDPSPDIRLTAALSLASSGKAPSAHELIGRLRIGTEEHSLLAVTLLREIARQKPEEIKMLVLDPATISPVKAAAIEALTASGDYSLVPVIAELAIQADPASEELPRYLRALADFAHPAGAKAIMHCLDSPSAAARTLAAKAAGRIGMTDALPRLGELLGDPEWWVRFRAGRALLRLGPGGEKLLKRVAAKGSEPARETALVTLAERIAA